MKLRGFDIDDLMILAMLLDEISVTNIGKKIHLTQPAITQRLTKMRRLIGFAVTIRVGNKVKLTQNGLGLAYAAREALILLLRSIPDSLGNGGSNVLVHYFLSKRGDRATNKNYDS